MDRTAAFARSAIWSTRKHPQYAGSLSLEQQLRIVRNGKGQAGGNIEYVLNTVRHLESVGVHDPLLAALAALLTTG